MARPLPKNLKHLYDNIGRENADKMMTGVEFDIDGVTFVSGYRPESTSERFFLAKPPDLIDQYREFIDERDPARVFELGIAEGGSTALLALRPGIEQLVAIDNEQHRLPALDELIDTRGLGSKVHPYFAVDQGDGPALTALVDRHFDGVPLDLVIDDASHDYDLTVASFNALYPRLAVGGWYMIEDWAQAMKFAETVWRDRRDKGQEMPDARPAADSKPRMHRLVIELTMAMGAWPGVVDRVVVTDHYVAARRGPEEVAADGFALETITIAAQCMGLTPRSDRYFGST